MNTYYIRTTAADYDMMITLGVALGAIVVNGGKISAPGGCWDYIGPINIPTGETFETPDGPAPVMAPRVDGGGNEYIHVNLVTPVNLKETATEMAVSNPAMAAGLANLGKYFLLDGEGNARPPNSPHRVFA
jgi:hypothetical protein